MRQSDSAYAARYRASEKGRASKAARLLRNRLWSWNYRIARGCTDCGTRDPRILEFDHIADKFAEVSRMVNDLKPIARLEAEAAKCEVRCRNCHFIKTQERQMAYSFVWYTEGPPSQPGSQKK